MKLPQGYKRIGRAWLPRRPVICGLPVPCVYREGNTCPNPHLCNGNGDAACHRMSVRKVMEELHEETEIDKDGR